MQHESRNISMLMDFYEMTMAHGYFTKLKNVDRVAFDVFFRRNPDKGGFAIFGGLEQIVEYILNLHFDESDISYLRSQGIFSEEFLAYLKDFSFTGDVYAFPEGSIIYPNEPVITIVAPLIDAQIIETAVLTMMNHQSLIATKANRIVRAADGLLYMVQEPVILAVFSPLQPFWQVNNLAFLSVGLWRIVGSCTMALNTMLSKPMPKCIQIMQYSLLIPMMC